MSNKIKPLSQLTVRCEEEDVQLFNKFHDQLGYATKGDTLQAILHRFEQPQVVEDHTQQLEAQLAESKNEIERLRDELLKQNTSAEKQKQDLELANSVINEANNKYLSENADLQNTIARLHYELDEARKAASLPDGSAVIAFTAENLAVLDYVCNRESRRRNTPWSRSHVINHFINSRFIKGELNGDLRSVSDSDIEKIRKTLGGQQTTDNGQQTTDNSLDL